MPPDPRRDVLHRLRSAQGHLTAVTGMVEAGEPCEQILLQIKTVQSALEAAGCYLILCQVQKDAGTLLDDPSLETRLNAKSRLLVIYQLLTKSFS